MKTYIIRDGQPDFVCIAPTIADALILMWYRTGETPRASYRVHAGRRCQAWPVSVAITFWRLPADMRAVLADVIQETSTQGQADEFAELVLTSARLLGK